MAAIMADHANGYACCTAEVQKSAFLNSSLQSAKMILFIIDPFCQPQNYEGPLS